MKLFKLNAINSTSTYLKQLSQKSDIEKWTVVSAEYQSMGRGQMDNKWTSENGKNLIISILITYENLKIQNQFFLNCAISLGIYNALQPYKLQNLAIKWPNDIMAGNKKLGGILIENSLKYDKIYQSVVGIGLNINQEDFSMYSFNAISLKNLTGMETNRDNLLDKLISSLKTEISRLEKEEFDLLHKRYEKVLYRINKPHMFESGNTIFMGKITGVSKNGRLQIKNENNKKIEFNFKEVTYL